MCRRYLNACRTDVWRPWRPVFTVPKAILPLRFREMCSRTPLHRGLTLVEMLLSLAILAMLAVAMAGLAKAVQMNNDYGEGHATVTQHARVVLERIERTVSEAVASPSFPGILVLDTYVGSWRFPDTLIVWHPTTGTTTVDPTGLPRFNELVIYYPNPLKPNQLVEVTLPNDTRVVPTVGSQSAWLSEVAKLRSTTSAQTVVMTDMLRTCLVSGSASSASRGAVRFESRLRPSADEWSRYRAGTLAWKKLSWVQGICGWKTGLSQAWVRIELQLVPAGSTGLGDTEGQPAVAFFGSATLYHEVTP